ncbi:MATK [Mytilus coruscus]|uniref:MATK n=1 Tax=Mytilus coruscus TaxID=42192 RepID=A0A6J8A4Z5_MYTCO|nr:MATK [Mytilus coruscus]
MQYLQTRAGTCLSTNDVIKCTDNDILKLYQPGLGGVRESPVHPGDYCGPCSLCKKDSNYGYFHLGSKSYQLDFVDFVKSKHKISEKDCICKSCMLKLNRNFSHTALAEESLQTAKKTKLECALALCNSCTNTSVTRNSPLDTDELNTCFSVSLQEAQIESIFFVMAIT